MVKKSTYWKDYINALYAHEYIFAKYLNIDVSIIKRCIEYKSNKTYNPLRNDLNPSLGFMYYDDDVLRMKDFADNAYDGDIYNLVGLITSKNSNIGKEFDEICNDIIKTCRGNSKVKHNIKRINKKILTSITFSIRNPNTDDINYWKVGNISIDYLKLRSTYIVNYAWIGENLYYKYNRHDPCYAYISGKIDNTNIIKLYFPKRKISKDGRNPKFITNNRGSIESSNELYKAEILIITKSKKDKMCLENTLLDYDGQTIAKTIGDNSISFLSTGLYSHVTIKYCVTNMSSESSIIKPDIINALKNDYSNIIMNLDYDEQGLVTSFYHYKGYGINTIFYGNNTLNIGKMSIVRLNSIVDKIKNDFNISVTIDDFIEYIKYNADDFTTKDTYDLIDKIGIDKASIKINELFNYEENLDY